MENGKERNSTEAVIPREHLREMLPGQVEPAVDNLFMYSYEGKIFVFVRLSDYGKTTKMTRHTIEPTGENFG